MGLVGRGAAGADEIDGRDGRGAANGAELSTGTIGAAAFAIACAGGGRPWADGRDGAALKLCGGDDGAGRPCDGDASAGLKP
jgi:hypothetical protein